MKKRRVGPLLLLAIFLGVGGYTYIEKTRADRFDKAFSSLLEATSTRIFDAANQPDKAPDFFAWVQGEGLQKLDALPPAPERFQQELQEQLRSLYLASADMYKKDPLQATSSATLQEIFLGVQGIGTALGQGRDTPQEF